MKKPIVTQKQNRKELNRFLKYLPDINTITFKAKSIKPKKLTIAKLNKLVDKMKPYTIEI